MLLFAGNLSLDSRNNRASAAARGGGSGYCYFPSKSNNVGWPGYVTSPSTNFAPAVSLVRLEFAAREDMLDRKAVEHEIIAE